MKRAFVVGQEDAAFLRETLLGFLGESTWVLDDTLDEALAHLEDAPEEMILSQRSISDTLLSEALAARQEAMVAGAYALYTLGGLRVPKQGTERGKFFLRLFLRKRDSSLKSHPRPEGFYDAAFFLMPSVMGWLSSVIDGGESFLPHSKWLAHEVQRLYDEQPRRRPIEY